MEEYAITEKAREAMRGSPLVRERVLRRRESERARRERWMMVSRVVREEEPREGDGDFFIVEEGGWD